MKPFHSRKMQLHIKIFLPKSFLESRPTSRSPLALHESAEGRISTHYMTLLLIKTTDHGRCLSHSLLESHQQQPMHAACCSESKYLHRGSSLSYLTSAKEHGPHSSPIPCKQHSTRFDCTKLLETRLSWWSNHIP